MGPSPLMAVSSEIDSAKVEEKVFHIARFEVGYSICSLGLKGSSENVSFLFFYFFPLMKTVSCRGQHMLNVKGLWQIAFR